MTEGVIFDALGTLLDLGRAQSGTELARTLHHATSLTLVDEFAPLTELARAVEENLPDRLARAKPFKEAGAALDVLAEASIPAYVLTNGSAAQTRDLLRGGDLLSRIEDVFSVEDVRRYKPDPAAYAHAARAIGHPPSALTFVSAHGWDILGASKAGYRTVWVERDDWSLTLPVPELRAPDLVEAAELIVAAAS